MGRLRGFLWLVAGIVVAVAAAAVAYITLSRAITERTTDEAAEPTSYVVVASHTLGTRSLLTPEDLELRELPLSAIPESAVRDLGQAIGKIAVFDLYPGEILMTQRLINPDMVAADGRMALVLTEDEILMAFPAEDLMSSIDILKPGDQVDLLFSFNFPVEEGVAELRATREGETPTVTDEEDTGSEQVTFNLLQNVSIAAIVGGRASAQEGEDAGTPEALLFTIDPQDALVLKYVLDGGGTVDVVLRSPGAKGLFSTEPVDIEYVINYYLIPTR